MGGSGELTGPDFSVGVSLDDLPMNSSLGGRVGDEAVLLSRFEDGLFAISGTCTHYGAALSSGLLDSGTVRCPLHHACFDLRTGEALRAPALDALDAWLVEVELDIVFVRRKLDRKTAAPRVGAGVGKIVIIGGGAAGLACANELRSLGYAGKLTMVSADADAPVDRPNLSKDYLAGTAPDEWLPLRTEDWYRDHGIDLRLACEVVRIEPASRRLYSRSGDEFDFDRLLIATGSEPNRLSGDGFGRDGVFTLRSFADARAIVARTTAGMTAAVIGASFIGLEAAAALRKRDVAVHVIAPEQVPFERLLGPQVGQFLQALHEHNGVRFHLGTTAESFRDGAISLTDGVRLTADIVLAGIGVTPRTSVAASCGIATSTGIEVDAYLQTNVPGIYAAGDIAAYPDPRTGELMRVEHWVVAERQGQAAAANMLGLGKPYRAVPFFWTEQYGVSLRYAGRAPRWDQVVIDGSLENGEFIARYYERGAHCASAAVGRDLELLEDERRFEGSIAQAQPILTL